MKPLNRWGHVIHRSGWRRSGFLTLQSLGPMPFVHVAFTWRGEPREHLINAEGIQRIEFCTRERAEESTAMIEAAVHARTPAESVPTGIGK